MSRTGRLIEVRAKPGSKVERAVRLSPGVWTVSVRARAADGKANDAIRTLLADTFGCRVSGIIIRRGHSSRTKLIEVPHDVPT